ncbi:DUF1553 domain-containing protein [Roseiconus nitratireducens]|uniref:DUF1553 domain-containing protein n=1 Tax=Roseiconus nitratireducens TaxID=2605748 RepID=UPI001F2F1989|nr:DUF1553 domain-containing protein [Roseiconus nitratireducens]
MYRFALCCFVVLSLATDSFGQSNSRADEDLFEIHVRPTLVAHCIRCHGPDKQEGGLKLTSLEDLLAGGDSGPAIVIGKPEESLLVEALRYESYEMPPDGQLEQDRISGMVQWIAAGAPWPNDVALKMPPKIADEDRQWWCYQPIADPEPPAIDGDTWCRNGIDHFVLSKLSQAGLHPAEPADQLTLIRRLHFTLTGLPPDARAIEEASSPDFDYDAWVQRLLDSPAYGENQARFWLDLVRYAESDGYRADFERPEAHHYRDYVIASFNEDKSYDQFVREQIAGDEIAPGSREALTATMYLRHWIYEHNQRDVETQWHEILSDITETTSDVFLAQGLKCARCHDHKFDPLLQQDYFRFKAFFAAFQPTEDQPIADVQARRAYQQQLAEWEQATAEIRKRLRKIELPVALKHATREGFDKFIPEIQAMIRKPVDQRTPYEHQIASLASRQFDLPYDKLDQWLSVEEQAERQSLKQELAKFDSLKPEPLERMKFVASDVGPVAPVTYVPDDKEKKPVSPGYLTLLNPDPATIPDLPEPLETTGRRTALANWIANPQNPLTARVIVNRIWQQHFGRGLVDNSSDFGRLGAPPTHPLLLDYLASRLIEDGWSLKKLHRRILTSATYRQSSQRPIDQLAKESDPNNDLLWRMRTRRLSGEEITDAVLAASGELEKLKRAIYKPVRRNSPDPLLAAFDAPDRIRSVGKRHRTTTSTQALLLANGSWSHQRARAIADRFESEQDDTDAFLQSLYPALFGRQASLDEVLMAEDFVERYVQATPEQTVPEYQSLVTMPSTGQQAVNLQPGGPLRMSLKASDSLPEGDFTIEAVVLLRSIYDDASVRTIVAQWKGSKKQPGWSLGVTSKKSRYEPRNLILQLIGKNAQGDDLHYEVVPSGLRPELNKPYYVAVRVDLQDPSESGITFYLKDLTDKDAKLRTASAKHTVVSGIRPSNDVTIGDRFGHHQWDGLIDSLRVEDRSRDLSQVAQADSPEGLPRYVIDWQFEDPQRLGLDSSGNGNHAWAKVERPEVETPREQALVALVHALLNSNELIYVD